LSAVVIVTVLEEPVKVDDTLPVGVTFPLAESLKANDFNDPVEPSSDHFVPFQTYSFGAAPLAPVVPYITTSPYAGVTSTLSILIGLVVAPSERAVVVTPIKCIACVIDVLILAISVLA